MSLPYAPSRARDRALALVVDLNTAHYTREPETVVLGRHGVNYINDSDQRWPKGWSVGDGWAVYFDQALRLYRVAVPEAA